MAAASSSNSVRHLPEKKHRSRSWIDRCRDRLRAHPTTSAAAENDRRRAGRGTCSNASTSESRSQNSHKHTRSFRFERCLFFMRTHSTELPGHFSAAPVMGASICCFAELLFADQRPYAAATARVRDVSAAKTDSAIGQDPEAKRGTPA